MWENHHVPLTTFLEGWTTYERAFYIGSALAESERRDKKQAEADSGSGSRTISGEEYMRQMAQG